MTRIFNIKRIIALTVMIVMLFSLAACNTGFNLAGYKAEAKAEIANYVTESNYCTDNWSIVCGFVDAGKIAVDAAKNKADVDAAVMAAKTAIDEIEEKGEMNDFKLTIAINLTTFRQDDDIIVEIELKNQSSESYDIAYFFLILPHIPSASFEVPTEMPEFPSFRLFESGETIEISSNIGGLFEQGLHEVRYRALFYLNWGEANEKMIEVWSEIITISIA